MDALDEVPKTFLTCEEVPIEVWIEVDGGRVPHYATEYNEVRKEASCWIESKVDKPFVIKYKGTTKDYVMCVKILVDGSIVANNILLPQNNNPIYAIVGVDLSPTECREFKFGSLELTDDDAFLQNPAKSPHVGEIRVIVDKASRCEPSSIAPSWYKATEQSKVHEKSKKGLTHQVKYGEKKSRYRPIEWLQASEIAMRDPDVPTPLQPSEASGSTKRKEMDLKQGSDNELEEDSADEEEMALLAQLENVRRRKQEKEAEASARKKIKLEPKNHFVPGTIIDLTDENSPGKTLVRPAVPKEPVPVMDLT